MNKNHKRISAAVLSLALGFSVAGAPVLAPMAAAQISANQASTVNLGAKVSLTIEKYLGDLNPDPVGAGLETIEGIEFLVEKVDADLTTTAGWEHVADLIDGSATPTIVDDYRDRPADEPAGKTFATNSNGKIELSTDVDDDFTVGVYRITELQSSGYSVVEPFYVTLPFTNEGVWDYNQTVQPKNQKADIEIDKDVDDLGVTLGKEIEYTISAPIPAGNLTQLEVVDNLQAELSQPTDTDFVVQAEYLASGIEAVESFAVGTDYNVTRDGNEFTVEFTSVGLGKLQGLIDAEGNTGVEISVAFKTTVLALPTENVIENHASIDFGGDVRYSTDPGDEDGPEDPEEGTGTETRLGQLTINKRDTNEALIDTDWAEFELWRCQAEGEGFRVIGEKLSAATEADDVNSVTTTFATGDEEEVTGQETLYGVQVINWVNNDEPTAEIGEDLCVVETKAPEGYVLNPEPQKVILEDASDEFTMTANVTNLTTDEAGGGQLPSTGGMGTMALIAGGLVVAAAGGAAAVRGNRARS